MPSKPKNLTGRVFGRLVVLQYEGAEARALGSRHRVYHYWKCLCECGVERTATSGDLLHGDTKSCGCLRQDTARQRMTTHGKSGAPEFIVWSGMRQRCNDSGCEAYSNYGGRGIRVDKAWDDFAMFLANMGARPSPSHTLERINNDGNYEPGNCKWETRQGQSRNTRRTAQLTFQGRTASMVEWSEVLGISYYAIRARRSRGWSDEKILSTPIGA